MTQICEDQQNEENITDNQRHIGCKRKSTINVDKVTSKQSTKPVTDEDKRNWGKNTKWLNIVNWR